MDPLISTKLRPSTKLRALATPWTPGSRDHRQLGRPHAHQHLRAVGISGALKVAEYDIVEVRPLFEEGTA